MGVVFRARHLDLDVDVALKLVRDAEGTSATRERFLREARAIAKLRSEHACRVLDVGTQGETPYLVLELLEGETLKDRLARGPRPTDEEAVRWVLEASIALAEAHAIGIVHRDVKPSNLFLARAADGTSLVKLLDFGVARALTSATLTRTDGMLGTPQYVAPEQIRDAHGASPAADLWSLAVVLYEALSGRFPHESVSVPGLLARIVSDPPVPLRSRRPELPEPLLAAVDRALTTSAGERTSSAVSFAESLAPFAGAEGPRLAARARATAERSALPRSPVEAPAPRDPRPARSLATTEPPVDAATRATMEGTATGTVPRPVGEPGPVPRRAALAIAALGASALVVALAVRVLRSEPTPAAPTPRASTGETNVAPAPTARASAGESAEASPSSGAPTNTPPPPSTSVAPESPPSSAEAAAAKPVAAARRPEPRAGVVAPPPTKRTPVLKIPNDWGARE